MYADTVSSNEVGKLSGRLLDLLTELGSRRSTKTDGIFIRPSDFAKYDALKSFLYQYKDSR